MTKNVYTPNWRDAHGLVHTVGTHSSAGVWAECGMRIAGPAGQSVIRAGGNDRYEETTDFPTCLFCLADATDALSWSPYEEVGVSVINVDALKKLKLD